MPDLKKPVDCPKCGVLLKYDQTLGSVDLYTCGEHGSVLVWPTGKVELIVLNPGPKRVPR